jgi:hypothetical protein
MNPDERSLLFRAESVYLRRWTEALMSGDNVKQRFYSHRLDEVRMCREAKCISDEYRRHLLSLFQSRSPKANRRSSS